MAVVGMTVTEATDAPPVSASPPATDWPAAPDVGGSDVTADGLARVRIAILLIGYLIVGAAAGGIFDQIEWVLIAAPVLPTVAAFLLVGRNGAIRALGAGIAIVMSVVVAVVVGGGGAGDVIDAFTSGIQGLLSTDWPSPTRADLVGAVVAVAATSTAISDELAIRRRSHLLPLLPLLLCYLGVIALELTAGRHVALAHPPQRGGGGLRDVSQRRHAARPNRAVARRATGDPASPHRHGDRRVHRDPGVVGDPRRPAPQ